jgi:ATP-dependent DNA helicase RecQ
MIVLKGAYYLDELQEKFLSVLGSAILDNFYHKFSSFTLENYPTFEHQNSVLPLLKVAWNIINRGDITRASLKLGDYLLKKHLGHESGFNFSRSEIKASLDPSLDFKFINEILFDYGSLTDEDLVEFGERAYSIFKLLQNLFTYNHLHKTMLLSLLANPTETWFKIHGISDEEEILLHEDLNELFEALNQLSDIDEAKIPLLKKDEFKNSVTISIDSSESGIILHQSKIEGAVNLSFKILTDRRINYKKLGKVIISEEETENGDRKEIHTFHYSNKIQEKALSYFLNNVFRKSRFRPGQEAIINKALIGEDVIGLLPTGGGKSLTFQICALLHPGVTIVVDPINSLMKDQHDKLIDNGIGNSTFINSFNSKEEREGRMEDLMEGKFLIVFVSPERFQMENFRQSLSGCKDFNVFFSYAVIDEAHCVSEWGHDFRHVYLNLASNLRRHCTTKKGKLSLFGLTATASFDVLADVQRELGLKENAIVTLPAEAIDRKELNFNILPISVEVETNLPYNKRENKIGVYKYSILKRFLNELPEKIDSLDRKYGYLSNSRNFYGKEDGKYQNAGIIFCPTKSNLLPNGVLHLAYGYENKGGGLSDLNFLELRTFFGGGSEDVIKDDRIESIAEDSFANQEDFIANRSNLMIATKAFGMGIDKPNIRYSIHYSFPSSVESFYQEAGRAGRDGNPSLCTILYHPNDLETNYDFYKNAFKGIQRERFIIDELLQEVQYEDGFFVNIIKQRICFEYPEVFSIKLSNDRYLYINGAWNDDPNKRIKVGLLDLQRNLRSYENATQNFDSTKANEILEYSRQLLIEYCPDQNYLGWFKTKSADGIQTLIESRNSESYILKIGFTNGVVSKMNEVIKSSGYDDFEERIIRAAYNFSTDENDFIHNLNYQYYKFQKQKIIYPLNEFNPNTEVEQFLKVNFYRIRNAQDTQRAIYRLNILGIIDDYVIDYALQLIEVRFKGKTDYTYKNNFKDYLRRYLGIETTNQWLKKINKVKEHSILTKVIYVLIEFIESEISEKRKRSILYMKELCDVHLKEGEREFRDRMIRYFTSKYARQDYLPRDTEKGTKENCEIVKKYIEFIDRPPDGLGGQIDNAKHLRGACDNLRINLVDKNNASIDLLTAFSLFVLDLKEGDSLESANEKPLVQKAIELYKKGFKRLVEIESWENVKSLLYIFNKKVLDFNSDIKTLMDQLNSEILIHRTSFRLKEFTDKISAQ